MKNFKTYEELCDLIENNLKQKNYDDIEKLAYMMMVIAKERSFSSEYNWNTKNNKSKIIKDLYKYERIVDLNNPQLICVTAARILKNIAKEFNIDINYFGTISGIVSENSFEGFLDSDHIVPVYKVDNNKFISADLEKNLDIIQTGKRWHDFGKNDKCNKDIFLELPITYIDGIMKKIGYINNVNDYLDTYIEGLFDKNYNNDISKKTKLLLENKHLSNLSSKLKSSVDIFRFYRRIIKEHICNEHRVLSFGGRISNSCDDNKFVTGIYCNENGFERFWLWSNVQNKMIEIMKDDIESFINEYDIKIYSGNDSIDAEEILKIDTTKKKVKTNYYDQFMLK